MKLSFLDNVWLWIQRAYRSRQIWLSAAGAAFIALEGVFGMLQPLLPVNVFIVLSVILVVGAAWIRTVTTVSFKDK